MIDIDHRSGEPFKLSANYEDLKEYLHRRLKVTS